jgi:hypothetical protein
MGESTEETRLATEKPEPHSTATFSARLPTFLLTLKREIPLLRCIWAWETGLGKLFQFSKPSFPSPVFISSTWKGKRGTGQADFPSEKNGHFAPEQLPARLSRFY